MIVVKGDSHFKASKPHLYPRDPDDPTPADGEPAFAVADVDRSIYFTDPSASATAITDHGQPFFTNISIAPLPPGRYAVVGSAGVEDGGDFSSHVGRLTTGTDGDYSDIRRVVLTPSSNPTVNQIEVIDNENIGSSDISRTDVKPAIAIPINRPQSLSITEPATGYTDPVVGSGWVWNPTGANGEGQYEDELAPGTPKPLDRPDDHGTDAALWDILRKDGTTANFRTVHLQRLANPLLRWDRDSNPYLTVDTMSVELTTFNGVTSDVDPEAIAATKEHFDSLERGTHEESAAAGAEVRKLWPHEEKLEDADLQDAPAGTGNHFFDRKLQHTLGYINYAYHPYYDATSGELRGDPQLAAAPKDHTFPWLTWNNRPFVSELELMQVPVTSSSRLLFDYTTAKRNSPADPYNVGAGPQELSNSEHRSTTFSISFNPMRP